MKFIVSSIEDWGTVARAITERLEPGMVVTLSGPLGAGKTTLVQALASALGVKKIPRSPTFSLMRTYQIKSQNSKVKTFVHVDAYRLERGSDAVALGLDEALAEPGSALVIEWPERLAGNLSKLSDKHLAVVIEPEPNSEVRRVRVE